MTEKNFPILFVSSISRTTHKTIIYQSQPYPYCSVHKVALTFFHFVLFESYMRRVYTCVAKERDPCTIYYIKFMSMYVLNQCRTNSSRIDSKDLICWNESGRFRVFVASVKFVLKTPPFDIFCCVIENYYSTLDFITFLMITKKNSSPYLI